VSEIVNIQVSETIENVTVTVNEVTEQVNISVNQTTEQVNLTVAENATVVIPASITDNLNILNNSWERHAANIKYNNTSTIASGTVLTGDFFGDIIYRYYANTNDANGYPLEDSFYSGFDGTSLTGLIVSRNV